MSIPIFRPSPAWPLHFRNFVRRAWVVSWVLAATAFPVWPQAVRAQLPGTLDPNFAPSARLDGAIVAIAPQLNGKLILGGSFYRVGSTVSPGVARLNVDGSVDPTFTPPAGLGQIVHLTVGPNGKTVLVTLTGDNYPGNYTLIRLNADGSRDASFAPAAFLGSPNTDDVRAFTVAVQADNKVLVAGEFYRATGIGPSIERFNTDGSPDTTFQFSKRIQSTLLAALLPLSNGQILVGGNGSELGGQSEQPRFLFRLNVDGSVDESYNPDTAGAGSVYALALQPDGKVVYLAYDPPAGSQSGLYTLGGVPRRLKADGTADTSFAPTLNAGATLTSLLLQPDGKVLVGGYTANSGSAIQNGVVRIDANGTIDATFKPAVPLVNYQVNALGLLPDGQIIVGGDFDTVAKSPRIGLARLETDGTLDASYVNNVTNVGVAYAVAVQASGLLLLLDSVDFDKSAATGQRAGLRPATELATGPIPGPLASFNANGGVNTVFSFEKPSGSPGYQIVVFPTLYAATATQPANSVLARQADGKILVTGYFADGEPYLTFNQIERFNVDGSLDTGFNYMTGQSNYGTTYAVLPQPDGKILRAGILGPYESDSYPLTRLNADGSYDATFSPAVNPGTGDEDYLGGALYALALQPDGKIIAGGALDPVNGQPVSDVLRFNADGSLDASFNSGVPTETTAGQTPYIFSLALQADGKVIVGGYFSALGGLPCNNLARLNADGSVDTTFDVGGLGTDGLVRSIALQTDGKIVLGGEFTKVNGSALNGVARLNADGSVDSLFDLGTGTGGTGVVNSVALTPDGRILLGGTFTAFAGQARDGAAELAGGEGPAPVIAATTATAQVGQPFTYTIPASGQPTGYTATGLPAGLSVSAAGVISGTPTAAGTFVVALSATNLAGVGTGSLTLTVNPAAPLVSGGSAAGQVGVAFSDQISATNSPVSYTAAPLPAGLTIDPTTGLISGTPTVAGAFTVTLGATNAGGTGTATLTLTVAAPPTVTIAALGNADAVEGGEKGKVAIRRDGDLTNALTVRYKVAGGAVAGKDYKALPGVATIPAGSTQVKIKIKPIDDGTPEGTRVAKVKLKPASDGSYTLGSPKTAKVHILDND